MANNRLFLRCRNCGEKIMIGKHMMDTWAYYDPYELGLKINDFFEKHTWCENGFNDFELCVEVPHDSQTECEYPVELGSKTVVRKDCSKCSRFIDGQCIDRPLEIYGDWREEVKKYNERAKEESNQ